MNSAKIYSFKDVILAIAISLMGFLVFNWLQSPLQHQLNHLFDANQYQKAYEFFRENLETYSVNYPFSVRILVPWIAAQLPFDNIYTNFKIVNLFFGIAWIPFWFYLGKNLNLGRFKTWLGWFWITFHWIGVMKANLSDPITVDLPLYLFQLLLLLALIENRWWLLSIVATISTIQKESILALLMILCVYPGIYLFRKGNKKAFWSILIALSFSYLTLKIASSYFPGANTGKNALVNLFNNTLGLLGHPHLFLRWIFSLTVAYSSFLWTFIWYPSPFLNPEDKTKKFLIPLVLTYGFFSLFAGGDFTRIAFLGAPFVLLFFLRNLQLSYRQWIILFSISLPAMRLFEFIPDGGADFDNWKKWYPEYAPASWLIIYGAYTLLVAVISKTWLKPQNSDATLKHKK